MAILSLMPQIENRMTAAAIRVPEKLRLSVFEKTVGLQMPDWGNRWPADVAQELRELGNAICSDTRFLGRPQEAEEFFNLVVTVITQYNGKLLADNKTHKAAHSLGVVRQVQETSDPNLPFEKLLRRMKIALMHDIMEDLKTGRRQVREWSDESVAAGVWRMTNTIPKGQTNSLEQYVGYLISKIYARKPDGLLVDDDVVATKKSDRLDLLGRLAHLKPEKLERQKNKCRHHMAVSRQMESPADHAQFYWKAQRVLQASLPLDGQTFEQAFVEWLGDKPAPLD